MKRHLQSLPTGHDNYEPVAYSQANPALNPADLQNTSDLATIWNGASTFSENIIEYAGRVCYRSTRRMGSAPRFIINRVKEGHEDIIEHLVATVRIGAAENPLGWRNWNRHCEITQEPSGSWLVSGNARVWLDLFRGGVGLAALPFLQSIAPKVYQEFADSTALPNPRISLPPACELPFSPHTLRPREEGSLRVTLLSFTQPTLDDVEAQLHHGSATFFFEGISRACTHQLVRHRLASFSQASQRYIQYEGHNPALPQASALPPFFAHIDTPLKAQVLGLLYADTITQQQPYISRPANDTAWLKRLGTLWGRKCHRCGKRSHSQIDDSCNRSAGFGASSVRNTRAIIRRTHPPLHSKDMWRARASSTRGQASLSWSLTERQNSSIGCVLRFQGPMNSKS